MMIRCPEDNNIKDVENCLKCPKLKECKRIKDMATSYKEAKKRPKKNNCC